MGEFLINFVKKIRGFMVRFLKPIGSYWFLTKSLKPLSAKAGFDRGMPIDRYYINKFMNENKRFIRGVCLEIGDARYTKRFGQEVSVSDVLDINRKNKNASIYGDLRNLKNAVEDNTYDCVILVHVLGLIDDYDSAVKELYRILKPGGALLFVGSYFSRITNPTYGFWRFTVNGGRLVFGKYFKKHLNVSSYGNVLVGQYFWAGASVEDLTKEELDYNDPSYPCIIVTRGVKEDNHG